MPRKSTSSRRLTVENLESRAMLAGNITVAVTDGVLSIDGDAALNFVQIRQLNQTFVGTWPGAKFEISGTNPQNQNRTTINGQPGPLVVSGVKSGVNIDLGDGGNYLRIANIFNGNADMSRRTQVSLPGIVNITGGSGDDEIRAFIENNSQVSIDGEGGRDHLRVSGSRVRDIAMDFGGTADHPADLIEIESLRARGHVELNTPGAAGNLGADIDFRGVCVFDGSVDVSIASGDSLSVTGAQFNGTTSISSVGSSSSFVLVSLGASVSIDGAFTISLGGGNDRLTIRGVTSSTILDISLGSGNDRLFSRDTDLAGINLDGGTGTDELARGPNTNLGEETIVSIEVDHDVT